MGLKKNNKGARLRSKTPTSWPRLARVDARTAVETWSFDGDAGRLFLRGQWALHRNEPRLNELFSRCSHLNWLLLENVQYKLAFIEELARSGDPRVTKRYSDPRRT